VDSVRVIVIYKLSGNAIFTVADKVGVRVGVRVGGSRCVRDEIGGNLKDVIGCVLGAEIRVRVIVIISVILGLGLELCKKIEKNQKLKIYFKLNYISF
jgi:hypothetical protein